MVDLRTRLPMFGGAPTIMINHGLAQSDAPFPAFEIGVLVRGTLRRLDRRRP